MSRRLLFVCPNLQAGGAERHWSILIPGLARRGFQVTVLTLDGRGPFFDVLVECGIDVASVADAGRARNLCAVKHVMAAPVDWIVSRAVSADGLSWVAKTMRPDVRWAANWHHPTGMGIAPRRRAILRWALPGANAVVAVSSSQIPELNQLGVRTDSIRVIPNGTDFQPAQGGRQASRAKLDVRDDEIVYLLVGRLEPQKRIDRFIDAIAAARRDRPRIVGLVAGAGPGQAELAARINRTGAKVRLIGRRDDMPDVLAAADALCLTSDYEALPFVVLEAMATGLPVVATRVGALPELLGDNAGVLVDPGDHGALTGALISSRAIPCSESARTVGTSPAAAHLQRGSDDRCVRRVAAQVS